MISMVHDRLCCVGCLGDLLRFKTHKPQKKFDMGETSTYEVWYNKGSLASYDSNLIFVLHCIYALLKIRVKLEEVTKTINATQSVVHHRYL